MSHQPERKEKDCLNCAANVEGRYCRVCGQENIVPHQKFFGLVKHFIYDVFHFDGKFFDTLKFLLFRPGFIAKQYVQGKRQSYLDPIRMYLFTSAIFFLVFFSITGRRPVVNTGNQRSMSKMERFEVSAKLHQQQLNQNSDSNIQKQLAYLLDTSYSIEVMDTGTKIDFDTSFRMQLKDGIRLVVPEKVEDSLTIQSKSSWLERNLNAKWKAYKAKHGDDTNAMFSDFFNSFFHKFPYLLFLSLPVFALILKLLYIRRKAFFYSDHAVFTLYHYIFSFILLLIMIGIGALEDWLNWSVFNWINFALAIAWIIYLYKGMKQFYGQGRAKTMGKFLALNLLGFISLLILIILFFLFTAFQIE